MTFRRARIYCQAFHQHQHRALTQIVQFVSDQTFFSSPFNNHNNIKYFFKTYVFLCYYHQNVSPNFILVTPGMGGRLIISSMDLGSCAFFQPSSISFRTSSSPSSYICFSILIIFAPGSFSSLFLDASVNYISFIFLLRFIYSRYLSSAFLPAVSAESGSNYFFSRCMLNGLHQSFLLIFLSRICSFLPCTRKS